MGFGAPSEPLKAGMRLLREIPEHITKAKGPWARNILQDDRRWRIQRRRFEAFSQTHPSFDGGKILVGDAGPFSGKNPHLFVIPPVALNIRFWAIIAN